jgi:hypothetical protein
MGDVPGAKAFIEVKNDRKTAAQIEVDVKALKEPSAFRGVRLMVGDQVVTVRAKIAQGAELALRSDGECWLYPPAGKDARLLTRAPALPPVTDSIKIEVQGLEGEPLASGVTVRATLLWPQEARE